MTAQESKLSNAYESTITSALTADASSITISVDTAPTDSTNTAITGAVVMYLVLDPDSDSQREYVKVTNISGTTLTVQRNIDTGGGGLRTHAAGAKIRQTTQAQHFDDIHDRVDKIINEDGSSLNTSTGVVKDEDTMTSNSASHLATQQSIKAYVDSQVASKDALSELSGTTDDVAEGSTNLYFTAERVDDQVNTLLTAGANVTLTYDDAAGTLTIAATEDNLSNNTTSDLAEGTNLYFTTERVDDQVASLLTAGSNITLTYDDAAGTLTITGVEDDLSNNTTSDLAEGTNLYYTDARADARVNLQTGSNLDLSSKSTSDLSEGSNLYYTTARFDTAFTGKSTTDLSEGTNLYYTTARFDTAFSGKDTDDLSEGTTNLYFTTERVDDQVNTLLQAGTNISLSYDDAAGTLTITGTDTDTVLTQEQVEDIVGSLIVAGTNVSVAYDDAAGTLTISSTDTNTQLSQEQVEDYVDGLLTAGSGISLSYDDAAGTLTITNTASTSTEEVQDIVAGQLVTNGTHTGISFAYDDAGDGAIDATVSLPASDEILDADGDTKIQVEESADEDIIRFDTAGVERATLQGALDLTDNGGAFIHSQTQAGTYTVASGKGTLFAGPITITGTVTNAGTMVVI
jgi:ribulose bisphosphate carboxylase small subunit